LKEQEGIVLILSLLAGMQDFRLVSDVRLRNM
jgi:hypothetical protein